MPSATYSITRKETLMQAIKNSTKCIPFTGAYILSNHISRIHAIVIFAVWQRQLPRHTITSPTYDTHILHIVFHDIYNYRYYFIKYDACTSV